MGTTTKTFALALTVMLTFSCVSSLTVKPAFAQTTPTPFVPQFTTKYADYSYSVSPTYSTDPYTGKNMIVSNGYTVVNRTVQFTIVNQQFNPSTNSSDSQLYYHIRYKGHYGSTWSDSSASQEENYVIFPDSFVYPASNSTYTNVLLCDYSVDTDPFSDLRLHFILLPEEGEIDFQIQALVGKTTLQYSGVINTVLQHNYYSFTGQIGGWSDIQTISIPNGTVTITPYTNPEPTPTLTTTTTQPTELSATPTPTVPEMHVLMILPLLVSIIFTALVVKLRKIFSINGPK